MPTRPARSEPSHPDNVEYKIAIADERHGGADAAQQQAFDDGRATNVS